MKKIILLVGETCSGKDTVANLLPYEKVVSFTTRPMRPSDIQGVTHHFITDKEMDEIERCKTLIAKTKTGKYRYCATADQIKGDVAVYIINPDGIDWFKRYNPKNVKIVVIGIYLPYYVRKNRCKKRGDDIRTFMERTHAEEKDYERFRRLGEFDFMFKNYDSKITANVIMDLISKYDIFHKPQEVIE